MKTDSWNYYNHAFLPNCAPHEEPDLEPIKNNSIWKWKESKFAVLARWTTDFDCGYPTGWWYCIKDDPYDIQTLKAKRRYEINRGRKNFLVKRINPKEYKEELYTIEVAAYSSWPEKYRPTVNHDTFVESVDMWNFYRVYGGFSRDTGKLCAYAILVKNDQQYIGFSSLRVVPQYEKEGINAAMVDGILTEHDVFLNQGGYICDGARSINHETAFQDYLEKYFGFRKAYCHLHIQYRFPMAIIIKMLVPLKKFFRLGDNNKVIHNLNVILSMDELVKSC